MSGSKQLLLLSLLNLLAFSLSGQDYYFHHLGQRDGLSNEFNAHFQRDTDGYFWTSSRDGLNRYDGKNISIFRPQLNGTSLDPNITSTIFEDSLGNKWFTSNNALHCLSRNTDSLSTFQKTTADNSYYYAFHLDQQNLLWLIIQDSLYTLDVSKSPVSFHPQHAYTGFVAYPWLNGDGEVKGLIRPLIENRQGIELLSYQPEMSRDTFFYDHLNQSVQDTFVFYLHPENDSSFWIPTSAGLIHFNPYDASRRKIYKHDPGKNSFSYRDVKAWGEDFLFVASLREGLFLFDKVKGEFIRNIAYFNIEGTFQKIDGLNSLLIDEHENLWLSFFDFGLVYTNLRNHKFSQLYRPDQLFQQKEKEIRAIVNLDKDQLLVLVKNEGVYQVNKTPQRTLEVEAVPLSCCTDSSISNIFKSKKEDHFWCLSNEQLFLVDQRTQRTRKNFQVSRYTYDFVELKEGGYLLLDINKLYFLPENFSQRNIDQSNSLIPGNHIFSRFFYFPETELVFLVQANNILRILDASDNFKELALIDHAGHINGMFFDPKTDLYCLASSTGLLIYDAQQEAGQQLTQPAELQNRSFTDVIVDTEGDIWLSSYWGLYKYQPDKDSLHYFTGSDGLYTMQYEENVSFLDEHGIMYFAGDNGLTYFNPRSISLNKNPVKIILQEAKVEDEKIPPVSFLHSRNKYVIPHHKNDLAFTFAAMEFSDPGLNSFEAFLIRGERDTLAEFFSEKINLPNLRQGNYQLEAFAGNSDGYKGQQPYTISFVVLPPWYFRWWALIVWAGLLSGTLWAFYKYRIRQIEKREAIKRQEVEFKQKEAEYKQLVAETETAVLRLQMNPHFIFNSMNAINSYILQKDVDTASAYLNSFAKLMRQILELSSHAFIEIAEEIEFLELYLETETMRLGKKLSYRFEVDPGLDAEETLLPTMILQPFVENAIWHGISGKKTGGLITIRFKKAKQLLLCEVEDNGVGRSFSARPKFKSHKSKAIEITRKRLAMLSTPGLSSNHLQIIDLMDDEGLAQGTLVKLFLPLMN